MTGTGTQSFTITKNGTIKAVYVNKSTGSISKIGTAVTNKIDDIAPATARIEVTSTGATSVSVTAYGGDNETGVAKYIFQKSTSGSTSGFTDAGTNTSTSTSTTSSISTNPETTYWFRVIVEDVAGNQKISDPVSTKTLIAGPVISVQDESVWTNSSKTYTISTRSGYLTRYTTDNTIPTADYGNEYTGQLTAYDKTYVRAVYIKLSTREVSAVTYKYINRIDIDDPEITGVTVTTSKSGIANDGGSCSVRVTMKDIGGSGVKYYRVYKPYSGYWSDWMSCGTTVSKTTNIPFSTFGSGSVSWEFQCMDQAGNTSRYLYPLANIRTLRNAGYRNRD